MSINQPLMQRALKRWSAAKGNHQNEAMGRAKLPQLPTSPLQDRPQVMPVGHQASLGAQDGGQEKAKSEKLSRQSNFFRNLRKHGSLNRPSYLAAKARRPQE